MQLRRCSFVDAEHLKTSRMDRIGGVSEDSRTFAGTLNLAQAREISISCDACRRPLTNLPGLVNCRFYERPFAGTASVPRVCIYIALYPPFPANSYCSRGLLFQFDVQFIVSTRGSVTANNSWLSLRLFTAAVKRILLHLLVARLVFFISEMREATRKIKSQGLYVLCLCPNNPLLDK